jgi:hypothetical protein
MREALFESILSADEEEAEARNVLDLGPRIKFPEDDGDYEVDFTDKEKNAKEFFESTGKGIGALSVGIYAGLLTILIASAFGIRSCKNNEADKGLKELGSYENYMKYNVDNQGTLGRAVGIGDIQSKAMYACIVSLARDKDISIDEAARQATSTYIKRWKKEAKGAVTNGFRGRITGVSVGKDVDTGERIVRVDSEWQQSHTRTDTGGDIYTYWTTEHGTVYIPMSEGNVYGMDDNGKSVNIGGSTFVFDEAKRELFNSILRETSSVK